MSHEPTEEELRNMHWKERYEYEAGRVLERLNAVPEDELLQAVREDRADFYYAIWSAIAQTCTLRKAGPVLWDFLRRSPGEANMLNRYHCAAALFSLLGRPDPDSVDPLRRRVQWDHDGEEARQAALNELWTVILVETQKRA